ncbi:shikimate kinase [Desulfuromonas sp. DDH964]|uniref:shikimate kinase n=1 Tax=Desulfuromonas sp. DDH964 TaxID=1823759 RepID=UPI0018D4D798|nr:shikimate kinase [Desulfuromonas sp. DDH964]
MLIGFMGAGKTTVGAVLAEALGYRLVDLDQLIVLRCGKSIPEIFSEEGEAVFRDYESAALCSLRSTEGTVLATGGGVVGRQENWETLRGIGPVVYLRLPWEIICQRLSGDTQRPLADQRDGGERLRRLWTERAPLYEQADLIIDGDLLTPEEIAGKIIQALAKE